MVWVVLIVGIGVLLLSLQGAGGFTRIDTSAAEKLINDGKVQSAKLDGGQGRPHPEEGRELLRR